MKLSELSPEAQELVAEVRATALAYHKRLQFDELLNVEKIIAEAEKGVRNMGGFTHIEFPKSMGEVMAKAHMTEEEIADFFQAEQQELVEIRVKCVLDFRQLYRRWLDLIPKGKI